jgi:hypothetical protein
MKFKVIDFDLRIKPSKNEGRVLVIFKTEYLSEQTMEVDVHNLDYILGMIFSNFKGTVVYQVNEIAKRE